MWPISQKVSYCFYLAGLVAALLTAMKLLSLSKSESGKILKGWSGTVISLPSGETLKQLQIATLALFAASLITFTHLTMREFHREDPIILRDVHVISFSGDTYIMDVRDDHAGKRNQFAVKFCSEVTPEIQPGVTLVLLQYREDMHNHCFEVDKSDEGYILLRRNNVPILTAFDRQ